MIVPQQEKALEKSRLLSDMKSVDGGESDLNEEEEEQIRMINE